MRARLVVWMRLLVCVAVMYGGGSAFAQRFSDEMGAFFTGESLPMPPDQNAKWEHIDNPLANAAAVLFEQGLANPQGLEYREIEIAVGTPWSGGGNLVKAHGWILPQEDGRADRFAVAWNGLVYPVARIGAAADVRKDWSPEANAGATDERRRDFDQATERPSVGYAPPTLLKLALLLRLGETEIVHRHESIIEKRGGADPYRALARDWTWFAFERAVCAHQRGDDRLARADARMLTRVAPLIEAEATRRGLNPALDPANARYPERQQAVLPDFPQLPALLSDAERRVANPKKPRPAAGDGPAGVSIAALIEDLENVDARQFGQPGGVSLAWDKRVQAFMKRGNAAVEPLLQAMAGDPRLTRSVSFGRDFGRSRELLTVSDAALAALESLLDFKFQTRDEKGKPYSRAEMADQIRIYWTDNGLLPVEERFYKMLADDQAGKDKWIQAARYLVQPEALQVNHPATSVTPLRPGEKARLSGEILRDGRQPSVAQLLEKRSDDIAAIRSGSTNDHYLYIDAGAMALYLSAWDKAAAVPVLKRRLDRAWKIGAERDDILAYNCRPADTYGRMIAKMTLDRAAGGDKAAYDEYAAWIQKADLKDVRFYGGELLEPLLQGAARPSAIRAMDYLFNDPHSPWSSLSGDNPIARFPDFWQTPLPLTASFRKQALRGLTDKSVVGSITFHPREEWDSRMEADIVVAGSSMGYRGSKGDSDTPPAGEKRDFRTCDLYTYYYARNQGGPAFQLFWPEAKRDAAVAACRAWLEAKK